MKVENGTTLADNAGVSNGSVADEVNNTGTLESCWCAQIQSARLIQAVGFARTV